VERGGIVINTTANMQIQNWSRIMAYGWNWIT
jgi:hypothetical protein